MRSFLWQGNLPNRASKIKPFEPLLARIKTTNKNFYCTLAWAFKVQRNFTPFVL
jgi:hypothetical protein